MPLFALIVFAAAFIDGGSGLVIVRDAQLTPDIAPTEMTAAGLPVCHDRYIGGTVAYLGVMAQDVVRTHPIAIVRHDSGYMLVD